MNAALLRKAMAASNAGVQRARGGRGQQACIAPAFAGRGRPTPLSGAGGFGVKPGGKGSAGAPALPFRPCVAYLMGCAATGSAKRP